MSILKDSVPMFLPIECTEDAFPFDNAFFKWVHLLQEVGRCEALIGSNRSKYKMASSVSFLRLVWANNKIDTTLCSLETRLWDSPVQYQSSNDRLPQDV